MSNKLSVNSSTTFSNDNSKAASTSMTSDHSFLRNVDFVAEPRNLPICAEFLCFHGILRNSVLAGDTGDKYDTF